MCLYPIERAYETAFATSPGADCQVPRPQRGDRSYSGVELEFDICHCVIFFGGVGILTKDEREMDFKYFLPVEKQPQLHGGHCPETRYAEFTLCSGCCMKTGSDEGGKLGQKKVDSRLPAPASRDQASRLPNAVADQHHCPIDINDSSELSAKSLWAINLRLSALLIVN